MNLETNKNPPENSYFTIISLSIWKKIQAVFSNSLRLSLISLLVILISYAVYELFRYDLVIKPFETSFNLSRQGYTGTVIAHRLQNYMEEFRKELNESTISPQKGISTIQFSELARRQEIDISTVGLSLNAIIDQVRRMLGIKQRVVNGDIVTRDDKLFLTLRITGQPVFKFITDDVKNPEPAIKAAAKVILETFEPLLLGMNYCFNYKNDKLTNLISYRQSLRIADKDKAIYFILNACLLKNQQQYEPALVQLEKAKKHDKENAVIFHIEGDILQLEAKYELAIEAYKQAIYYDSENGGIYTQWARALIQSALNRPNEREDLIEQAFAKYEEAAFADSDNPWINTDWAYQLAVIQGKWTESDEKFMAAIDEEPRYALAYVMWGDVLLKIRNQPKAASEKYAKAVTLNYRSASFYGNWGHSLIKQHKLQEAISKFEQAVKIKPLAWVYKEWGDALLKMKEYKQARSKFTEAIKLVPNEWYSYYMLGTISLQLDEYSEAIFYYSMSSQLNPKFAWTYNRLSYTFLQAGKVKQAQEQCKYVLGLKDISNEIKSGAHAVCGLSLIASQQVKAAIDECKIALKLNQTGEWVIECLEESLGRLDNLDDFAVYEKFVNSLPYSSTKGFFYYAYGSTLAKLKQYEPAISQYKKAAQLDFDKAVLYGEWGTALLNMNLLEPAIEKYKMAQERLPRLAWVHGNMGDALFKLTRFAEAIEQYRQALELEPKLTWVRYQLCYALQATKQYQAVVSEYQIALEQQPKALHYSELGTVFTKLRKYEAAIIQYKQAIALETNNYRHYYKLGKALNELGKYPQAIVAFKQALELKTDHIWSQIMLGYALIQSKQWQQTVELCENILQSPQAKPSTNAAALALCGLADLGLEHPDTAIEKCQKSLTISTKEDWAYWCLGDAFMQQKDLEQAAIQFKKAVELKPAKGFYYYNWGQVLVQLNQEVSAIKQYEMAIELTNNENLKRQIKSDLNSLKDKRSYLDFPMQQKVFPMQQNKSK